MVNLVEILRFAPQGLKLYSLVHGEVTFKEVDTTQEYYPIYTTDKQNDISDAFTKDGKIYYDYDDAECILFPSKEHKSWDNWQEILFKPGDLIICEVVNISENQQNICCIYNGYNEHYNDYAGHFLCHEGITAKNLNKQILLKNARYATPEEREQFFNELNDNGYTWNDTTKQMENSLQQLTPKYKVGDYIIRNSGNLQTIAKVNKIVTHIGNATHYRLFYFDSSCMGDYSLKYIESNFRLATEQELIDAEITKEGAFTIDDLKPFDKVLVKNYGNNKWVIDLFGYYDYDDKAYFVAGGARRQCCVPYNDETKHLLGTTDDCPKKYKTW